MFRRQKQQTQPTRDDGRVAALVEEQKVLHGIAWDLLRRHGDLENMVDYWRRVADERGDRGYRERPPRTEPLNALLSGYVTTLTEFADRWSAPVPNLNRLQADHVEALKETDGTA